MNTFNVSQTSETVLEGVTRTHSILTNDWIESLQKTGTYTSCYCEENVWMLLNAVNQRIQGGTELDNWFAVFISNKSKVTALWCQKSGKNGFVLWDYHVICVYLSSIDTRWHVLDYDSTLPWNCTLETYFNEAICPVESMIPLKYRRKFRFVPAKDYLSNFSSDRMHMFKDGQWLKPPPNYPPILHGPSNLFSRYIDMGYNEPGFGIVIDEGEVAREDHLLLLKKRFHE